ncbi:Dolichol kinase [Pseudoloma neurophilia]|uniref:Dolichol kinase n=1 Tax=Pseudoloma neurophilia TaxID=146866 RepID=A0A0R0M8C3_9MICR|nr:Dolichol kinase [Pseudoloma neurophilia]
MMFESLIYFYYLKIFLKSFTTLESFVISCIVPFIRMNCDGRFINPILYYQIIATSGRCLVSQAIDIFFIFDIPFLETAKHVIFITIENITKVFFMVYIVTLLAIFMFWCQKTNNVNLARKSVHFTLFVILLRIDHFTKEALELVLLFNHFMSSNFSNQPLFQSFKSMRDFGDVNISNILILATCYFTGFFLFKYEDFIAIMISLLILDSATSIIGQFIGSKGRNKLVTGSGVFIAVFTHFLLFSNFQYSIFYIIIGFIEYFTNMNDNLAITVGGVIMLRFFRKPLFL